MATIERHLELSVSLMDQAEEELRGGDVIQASEKAWGAVVHYVSAVSRKYGWPLGFLHRPSPLALPTGHDHFERVAQSILGERRQVRANAHRLIRLTRDQELNRLRFLTAEGLNANFYQEFHDPDVAAEAIGAVRLLLSEMQTVEGRGLVDAEDGLEAG